MWLIITIDLILFFFILITVLYLFVFSFNSQRKRAKVYKTAKNQHSILVLIPAYKEDSVIFSSVESILNQDYPPHLYDVIVISDKMKETTNNDLSMQRINLLVVDFENSTKAKALNYAIDSVKDAPYDIVVLLDADNTTNINFLNKINNTYDAGIKAIQAHRVAKNRNTDTAVLDALSEEINNSIFRKGYVNMGLSSSLIGSGMAFDYKWFKKNIKKVTSVGEDKELELLLYKQSIYVEYLDEVMVYDEKTQSARNFYNQRRRWIAVQLETLANNIALLPKAISTRNIDLICKIVGLMILPRSILVFIVGLMSVALLFSNWLFAIKWWIVLILLLYTFSCATPDYLIDKKFYRAIRKVPLLMLLMVMNLFRLKGATKKFIHTNHSNS